MMKLRRMVPVLLSLALLASLLTVPALAADSNLTLREDWRLSSTLDLEVPSGIVLTINGNGYHIYEMGGTLTNTGAGIVQLAEGTILYPAGGNTSITVSGIWDTEESNALLASRQGAYLVRVGTATGGRVTASQTVARASTTITVTATPSSGYTLSSLTVTDAAGQTVAMSGSTFTMPGSNVTVSAVFTARPVDTGSSSSDDDDDYNPTTVVKNPDGSTTTKVTNSSTGTVTETTKYPDGSKKVVVTKKDGTVTTTTDADGNQTVSVKDSDGTITTTATDADGKEVVTVEDPDGSVTTTTTDADGSQVETVSYPDGSGSTTVTQTDGCVITTATDAEGQVTATQVALTESLLMESGGTPVALPIPALPLSSDPADAPTLTLDLPAGSRSARVEIPVENVTPGTVAVLVRSDGTETVIPTSLTTENGVAVVLDKGASVKIVDNTKSFADVPAGYWGAEAVSFVSSRAIFSGTGADEFSPETPMSRAMIVTVLARMEGVDTASGVNWYDAGAQWAVEQGISDGTNLDQPLTREQLATMLYRYAGQPSTAGSLSAFPDGGQVSGYAAQAMAWAVENGLIGGTGAGTLNPQGEASRVEVAAILQRFVAAQNR